MADKINMKKEITDVTVIIPVHELTENYEVTFEVDGEEKTKTMSGTKQLFKGAVKSVGEQQMMPEELLIVVAAGSDAHKYVTDFDYGDIKGIVRIIENPGKTDFASQMNYAVENTNTGWFTFLEYDDEMSPIWVRNVVEYRECYDDVEMFLPIIVDANHDNNLINVTNNPVWAHEFCDEMGYIDKDILLRYENFNIDGMAMSVEAYTEWGGIKSSIKLSFIYEFLLRMTQHNVRIMVIPKYGYKHINQREGSLFHNYLTELDPIESKWWLSLAKKEYFHVNDRNITYDQETT